jgi:CDGSH-type Zn-finger protein
MGKDLPFIANLEQGTYFWCSCGESQKEPFCDGSHQGTSFVPVEFSVAGKTKAGLCQCQRTKKAPYCDGAHARVD